MTNVSGSATKTSAKPNNSCFSAIAPTPAAPIRACAIPVPSAPNPKAKPAPIGIHSETIFYQLQLFRQIMFVCPLATRIRSDISFRGTPALYHLYTCCLLYTSDAADEEDSVDLGGRRIIKKK